MMSVLACFAFSYFNGMLVSIPMNVILCDNEVSEFDDPYVDECEYEWPCVGMRMGMVAVL